MIDKTPITEEQVEQYLKEIFYEKAVKNVRNVIMWRGCKTYGTVQLGGGKWESCNDPECAGCVKWHTLLKEEAEKFLKNYEEEENRRSDD